MKRYYICKIIGPGADNDYQPAIGEYPVNWVAVVGSNPDGRPRLQWALVLVDTVNHDLLLGDNRIRALPDATLDSTFGALNKPTRDAVTDAFVAEGIDTAILKLTSTIREILRYLGQQHADEFSENNFDVMG